MHEKGHDDNSWGLLYSAMVLLLASMAIRIGNVQQQEMQKQKLDENEECLQQVAVEQVCGIDDKWGMGVFCVCVCFFIY